MNINITKYPVVIFASPRTGSNAIGHHITNSNPGTLYYSEPAPDFQLAQFIAQSKNKHVLKIIVDHIPTYPATLTEYIFSDQNFKIKLRRKDIIEQIASYYIALIRNVWVYWGENRNNLSQFEKSITEFQTSDLIMLDEEKINICIKHILESNKIAESIIADLELCYEDIIQFNSKTKPTPRPANYQDLVNIITKLLKK